MSSNCECNFVQVKPDEWFYVLEDSHAPKNSWDWREHATAYGPFKTVDLADEHLCNNHSNPGGSSTEELPEGVTELNLEKDKVLHDLIAAARKESAGSRSPRFGTLGHYRTFR